MTIKTGCWFARIPDDHMRISISRGSPRGVAGWRSYRGLAPWFHGVPPGKYLTRYEQILAALDPAEVAWRASQL